MKKAYRTTWNGIATIVSAESVSQARYRTTLAAASAGWPPKWTAIRVVRAPEWDAWAAVDESGRCWSENYLVHFDIPGTKKVCSIPPKGVR